MSTIEKIRPWASSGTKTKPADVKIDTGWIGGQQPEHEYENERMNTRDTKLNQVIDQVNRGSSGAEKLFNNLAAGAIKDIAFPHSDGNQVDFGNGFERGACLYDYDGTKLVLSWHQPNPSANWHLYGINVDTLAIDVDLEVADMGLSGHRIWAMACDGQWLYMIGEEANASYRRYQVYARDIDGVDKPGFGYNQLGQELDANKDSRPVIKVLQSGDIFVGGRWDALGDEKCHIIDADTGTIIRSGNVDMVADVFPSGDCVEAGGHIFFTGKSKTTTDNYLLMVDESDLTVKAAGTYGVDNYGAQTARLTLATMGQVLCVKQNGNQLTFFDAATYADNYVAAARWNIAGSLIGPMFFDGHNLWMLVYSNDTTPEMLMVKMRPQSLTNNSGTVNLNDTSGTNDVVLFARSSVDANVAESLGLVFDGASIWASSYQLGGGGIWRRVVDAFTR